LVAAVVVVGTCALWLTMTRPASFGEGESTISRQESSLDGEWLLVARESHGPKGSSYVSGEIYVVKERLGVARWYKSVWRGKSAPPEVSWLSDRTLLVDGRQFDIYTSPTVDAWANDRTGADVQSEADEAAR